MFSEIIECEYALDEIKQYGLDARQINTLLTIIVEHPKLNASSLLEIAQKLVKKEKILLNSGIFSLDPILNESKNNDVDLLEFAIPAIMKFIPSNVLSHLSENHVRIIVDKFLDIEFDSKTTPSQLKHQIDEMFLSGDIKIPVQGLRQNAESVDVVIHGSFAPMLHKAITFGEDHYDRHSKSSSNNKMTLRDALKDYKFIDYNEEETPLMQLLPKFSVVLKKLSNK